MVSNFNVIYNNTNDLSNLLESPSGSVGAVSHIVVLHQTGAYIVSSGQQGLMVAPLRNMGVIGTTDLNDIVINGSDGTLTITQPTSTVGTHINVPIQSAQSSSFTYDTIINEYEIIPPGGQVTYTFTDVNNSPVGITFGSSQSQTLVVTGWVNGIANTIPAGGSYNAYSTNLIVLPDSMGGVNATVKYKNESPLAVVTYTANAYGSVNGTAGQGNSYVEVPVSLTADISAPYFGTAGCGYYVTINANESELTSSNIEINFTTPVILP